MDFDTDTPPPLPPRNRRASIGRTLRRGTVAFGRAVGDFFGVTEESQLGTDRNPGWGQVAGDAPAFNALTLSRRGAQPHIELPPDYNSLEMNRIGANFQSFDPGEISSSDSDDETFFGPPPSYPGVSSHDSQGRITSMYGHEDPTRSIQTSLVPITEVPSSTSRTEIIQQEEEEAEDGFIRDPLIALQYYQKYLRAEQRVRQRQNRENAEQFFGEPGSADVNRSNPAQTGRRGRVSSVGEAVIIKKKKGRSKLERQNTMVRQQVESLPSFWPIFIFGITFVQVVVVVVLIILNGLAPIHIFPERHVDQFPSLANITGNATVVHYHYTNPWIGIGVLDFIQCGAKFTPCMREDKAIINRNLIERARIKDEGGLGCCRNNIWVGTSIFDECAASVNGSNNTDYIARTPCEDTSALLANFHPCCIGITGQCMVTHIRECTERGGIYHSDLDSCNETNCLNSVCGFNGIGAVNGDPLRPSGNQGWRLVLSLFVHLGIIDVVIIGIIQLYVGIKIERTAGFIRIALIYFISGIGGNLMSAIFVPYQVNGGAGACVFGMIAVLFVELFQSWQLIDRAWLELLKLLGAMVVLLVIGTLPFIDNLANIGGLLFGIPTGIIFLPYITFGKVDAWRKRILLIICIPILLLMFIVSFFVFYFIPDPDFCSFCHYFNCIPFTSTFCSNEVNNPDPDIVAI